MSSEPLRRGGASGFTLIEVLVALTILALSLGVFLNIFSTGLKGTRLSEAYSMATMLAESKLATIGVEEPLEEGESSGRFDDRFAWMVDVRPHESMEDEEEGSVRRRGALEAFDVVVTVSWDDRNDAKSISLTTLRLARER